MAGVRTKPGQSVRTVRVRDQSRRILLLVCSVTGFLPWPHVILFTSFLLLGGAAQDEVCISKWRRHGRGREWPQVQVDTYGDAVKGERNREREREIINCKWCCRGQILPEAVTASFCVKFLDRKPPACWWILNGNQSCLNKCPHPPSPPTHPPLLRFHYCELIRLYLSNFWSWQNVNLSWDFSLLFCLWPAAPGLACCNNLNLSPEALIIVTLLACKLFN